MRHLSRITCLAAFIAALVAVSAGLALAQDQASADADHPAFGKEVAMVKNVIFMVPDGMGLADVTAARIFLGGDDGEPLEFETFESIGYQRTFSADSSITDSAAAASAWAAGDKFVNGEISFHDGTGEAPITLLELARDLGKATGLVATSTITHATPAAFGSHVYSRKCEQEIARQYVQETMVDVILGGGIDKFISTEEDPCGTAGDFVQSARDAGYKVVLGDTPWPASFEANPPRRLLGLFTPDGMTPVVTREPGSREPYLSDMTWWALRSLEMDPDGFFLMVEGSQIDWANHANEQWYQIGEMADFNNAVGVVKFWLETHPSQVDQTLIVVVADHETGGYAINGPYGMRSEAGSVVLDGWTSGDHTAVDTLIWAQGPGSQYFGRALDNTDLFGIIKDLMGAE